MAVKVMVAPAVTRTEQPQRARAPGRPGETPRPKRRRSSVYDADGAEVFITLMCLKCHKMRPLSQFGLRKMADGAIRNQPWCRTCRSAAGTKGPRGEKAQGSAGTAESPVAVESLEVLAPEAAASPGGNGAGGGNVEARQAPGNLAAQVAAALSAGLGR